MTASYTGCVASFHALRTAPKGQALGEDSGAEADGSVTRCYRRRDAASVSPPLSGERTTSRRGRMATPFQEKKPDREAERDAATLLDKGQCLVPRR